nr:interleukin-12 receptor subunit beta-2 isoform X1 [Nothobranchius furzeri]
MFLSLTSVIALTLLAVQNCVGEPLCVLSSSVGSVVLRGSSFHVYCTFKCKCKGSMCSNHPPTLQGHKQLNSTTIYLHVKNITEKQTYSCHCSSPDQYIAHRPSCPHAADPCGLDILVGYPPDPPKIVSCIYETLKSRNGVVNCTWNRGRDTHLKDHFELWVRTGSGNHIEVFNVSSKRAELLSTTFSLSRLVQSILVQVQSQNALGSVESSPVNYTVSDIVRPSRPVLQQPECSSRYCIIKAETSVKIQSLQIQIKTSQEQEWKTHPDSVTLTSSSQAQNISSLEPYRSYDFRARSKFSTGLWSVWSESVASWTQEEAPSQALDVWFPPDVKPMTIYWKEANTSISSGRILDYRVRVHSRNRTIMNSSTSNKSFSGLFCADCKVTVWARNSKGLSPPATITIHRIKANTLQDVRAVGINSTIAISWRKLEAAPAEYVVEWYPEDPNLKEIKWVRLGKNNTRTVLTGISPWVCYEGAVFAFYNEDLVSRTKFKRVATLESAPTLGPSIEKMVEGGKTIITWPELPRIHRRGCITKYTIYLKWHRDNKSHQKLYFARASDRKYVMKDLPSGRYSLWMSASTAKGESPAGQKIEFFVEENTQLPPLLVFVLAAPVVLFLCCLCNSATVKQRFREYFYCLIPEVVPDPANSKWAKECTREKGKMSLQLPSGSAGLIIKEDETIPVNVEELSKQICDTPTSLSSPPLTSMSPETEQIKLLYPCLPYIKSLSQDSDSSDHTETSQDTTVDYITSHGPELLDAYDQEDGDEPMHFVPSLNIFIDPLEFGGKLTLDAVKIDCSDFF